MDVKERMSCHHIIMRVNASLALWVLLDASLHVGKMVRLQNG